MGILDLFRRKAGPVETRASGSGFTADVLTAREAYISGSRGVGELTATVQSCVSLWEHGMSLADVRGTGLLTRHVMAMAARSLALRGEAVFLIRDDRLIPASDWDLSTRDGIPRAYRLSVAEAGGGRTETALAAEVLHIRIGSDPVAPWHGTSPLRRSSVTAGLLQAVEVALAEAFETMPLGSQIVPFPEAPEKDLEAIGRGFRGRRGRVMLRESVQITAAGGPAPASDWKPQDVTPDLSRAMTRETLQAAQGGVCNAFGVLPALLYQSATGPLVREAQRHLAGWTLQPIAELLAEEASAKLGGTIEIDTMRPLQAFDAGGRARALKGYVDALSVAKQAGLTPGEVAEGLRLVDWQDGTQ